MKSCDNCNQVGIETKFVELIIPTQFGEIEFCATLCNSCQSAVECCAFHYFEMFDRLGIMLKNRAMQLKNKTRFLMK